MLLHSARRHTSFGFGLLEALVTAAIIAVGFLAIASLQVKSLQQSDDSERRSRAAFLAEDMVNRMRLNRVEARKFGSSAYVTPSNAQQTPSCLGSGNPCTALQQANRDLYEWQSLLSNTQVGLLNGSGTVTYAGNSSFTITVNWNERDGSTKSFSTSVQP